MGPIGFRHPRRIPQQNNSQNNPYGYSGGIPGVGGTQSPPINKVTTPQSSTTTNVMTGTPNPYNPSPPVQNSITTPIPTQPSSPISPPPVPFDFHQSMKDLIKARTVEMPVGGEGGSAPGLDYHFYNDAQKLREERDARKVGMTRDSYMAEALKRLGW